MQSNSFFTTNLLQSSKPWLFGIAVSLIALHISLTWKLTENVNQLSISILIWGAFLSVLWNKRSTLNLESGITSSVFGTLLIALVLFKSLSLFWFESSFLKILPFAAVLGLGLLASDFKGLRQFWREFVIVSLLIIPGGLVLGVVEDQVHLSLLTAKSVTFFLWYSGFEVSRQGTNIILPTGAIDVRGGCSGFQSIFLLLRLAVLYLLMFPTSLVKAILVPIAAVCIGFIVNSIRVALMAILVAFSNPEAFEYWHKGTGSQVFSMIAVIAFGLLCSFLIQQDECENQSSTEQSES